MAYEMVMPYHLHMPSYFLETFTEYPYNNNGSQGRLVPGMVSFKLGDYSPENSELKGIKVLVNPVDGEEKTYIFSYPLTGEDVPGFNPLDLAELK